MVHFALVAVAVAALGAAAAVSAQIPQPSVPPKTPPAGSAPKAPVKTPAKPAATPAARAGTTARPASETPRPTAPAAPSDVKVVTTYTQGAQVSVNTTYLGHGRQRVEFPGLVSIGQCDLKRTVLLSPEAKRFRVQPDAPPAPEVTTPALPDMAAMAAAMGVALPPGQTMPGFPGDPGAMGAPPKSGVVTITTTVTDTLERQTLFGLEARHIKTVVTRQTTGDVCDKTPMRTDVDAWYVDLPATAATCGGTAPVAPAPPAAADDACQDRTETRLVGDVTLGFPVKTVTTNMSGEGDKQEVATTSAEVTALDITRLDRTLFDVPADYTEAKSALELTPSLAAGNTLADALFGSIADGTSTATAKPAGVIRIGVLEPVNTSARGSLKMRALRQELVTKLTKGQVEAVPLNGARQVDARDAAKLECDFVLATELTDVKTSKPGKLRLPGGGPAKDHHEVKMAYRLFPADGTASIKAAGDVKADNGGGFSLGSALRLAAFAGQLYMGFGGMGMMSAFGGAGGMGMGMGMMNPMFMMSRGGGMGALGKTFYDPRSMAMSSMAMGFGGMNGMAGLSGLGDPSEAEVQKVVSKALDDVAKGTVDGVKNAAKAGRK